MANRLKKKISKDTGNLRGFKFQPFFEQINCSLKCCVDTEITTRIMESRAVVHFHI